MARLVKKPKPKTDKAQSDRFKAAAEELEAAGELNLTEADETVKSFIDSIRDQSAERGRTKR